MIDKLLLYAYNNNCSDLHLSTNNYPLVRIQGNLMSIPNSSILTAHDIESALDKIMSDEQKHILAKKMEIDFSIELTNKVRFRANVFSEINGYSAAFRVIPNQIVTLEQIGLPSIIKEILKSKQGLVLIAGPTGSGKSTTLAAMTNYLNDNYNYHIITIEDPIEFTYKQNKSLITQREVGNNTLSFSNALKNALRQDPNVILIGELRDAQTIKLALTAAETGHLVLATLHTNSATQSINRIIDVFDPQEKESARSLLSTSLKAVISQRLLQKTNGERRAVFEIMIANQSIRNLIREDKIPQIQSIIEINKKLGMITLKDAILELLNKGIITNEIAKEAILSYD